MIPLVRYLIVATLLLTVGVCPAAAQQSNRGLFRGLFGGAEPVIGREHMLDLSASAFAGWAENLGETDDSIPSATFPGGNASLIYSRNWKQAGIGAYASAGTAYVDERKDIGESPWVNRWNVGGHASYHRQIARKTSFSASGSLGYSPYYGLGIGGLGTPGFGQGIFTGGFGTGPDRIAGIPGLDDTVAHQPSLNSTGSLTLNRALSSRSSLEGYYSLFNLAYFGGDDSGFSDQLTQSAGSRYRYSINRYVSARAGYGYSRSEFGSGGEPITSHLIDVGVDGGYGREFQIARRTSFSFNTTSSVFVSDQLSTDDTFDPATHFFVGGEAALAHRWGRTWQADARYNRGAGFADGFQEPVFTNSASASVRGVPLPRVDFIATATHIIGEVGFTTTDNNFSTTTGTAQLRFALVRNLAVFVQYFYYHYDFEQGVTLPGTIQPQLDRQGASVGVTYWLPLL